MLDPLELGPEVRRLLVSPHGELSYVPFSTLVGDREVVFVPSGTTYLNLVREQVSAGRDVVAFGNPDYGRPTARLEAGTLRSGGRLAPLPGSGEEAKAVGDLVHLGQKATESVFRDSV